MASHETLREPDRIGGVVSFVTRTSRSEYRVDMHKPAYQPQNAACALALAEGYLGRVLDASALERSLDSCPVPGRFDIVRMDPLVLVDACHNPLALAEGYLGRVLDASALERSLDSCPVPGRFDIVRMDPLVLVDACHNPQSCENFIAALDEVEPSIADRPTLLIAALSARSPTRTSRAS